MNFIVVNPLVKALHLRETGRPDPASTWFIIKKLDELFLEEVLFDHSLLITVLDMLKYLALKHTAVRGYMFEVFVEWRTDEDSKSIVLLARRLARDFKELALDFLMDLAEEIIMFSN